MRRFSLGVAALAVCVSGALLLTGVAGGKKGPRVDSKTLKATTFAVLSGANEISPTGQRGAGDPDGHGSFTGIVNGDELCFGLTVNNIANPIAAHVHRGKRNENGPIVITLTHPSSGDPGTSSGCASADPALLDAIVKHPKRYYVNVHTPDFTGGAVRGQLFRAKRGQAK